MAPTPLQHRRTHNTLLFQKLLNQRDGASPFTLILDTLEQGLNPIAAKEPAHLATFLSSLIISPAISLIATLHQDIPTPKIAEYAPDPITLLDFLATTVLRLQNLTQVIKRKRARDRSHQEPVFGLPEQREGVLVSLPTGPQEAGIVVEMELRRKSGRGILESFILTPAAAGPGQVALLDDHPAFVTPSFEPENTTEEENTFSMGLTEKQKRDREGVVLPYFDAQKDGGTSGPGDGGRILYEMGEEDKEDFDDEEDEV
ncbi:histone acetylation protein 2 [Phlyctema vagabunda]|uniref:Elongator complex protein 5 n=1 Tax=Phlyctema vagabunda TaxID=108571 RepID=A0ABR4PUF6_9HELO